MRKTWPVWILLVAVVGCADEQATEEKDVLDTHILAVQQLQRVEAGYVPAAETEMTYQAYRQSQLPTVIDTLKAVVGKGTPSQQVATNRQLSQLYASQARAQVRDALQVGARLSNRSAVLVTTFGRLRTAAAAANRADVDMSESIRQLQDGLADRERAVASLQGQVDELTQRITEREAEMARLQTQAEQAMARAVELRSDAFIETGEQQLKLYEEALTLERRASTAQAQRQTIGAQVDIWKSERQVVQGNLDLAIEARDRFQELFDETRARQQANQAAYDAAIESRDRVISELEAGLDDLQRQFTEHVQARMTDATAKLDMGVDLLEDATGKASGQIADDVYADLLTLQLDKLYLIDGYLSVLRGYGSNVLLIATMGDAQFAERQQFANTAARLTELHDSLVGEGQALLATARQTATELTDEQQIIETNAVIDSYAEHIASSAVTVSAADDSAAP